MSSDLAGKYSVTTEYALFIVSNEDLTSLTMLNLCMTRKWENRRLWSRHISTRRSVGELILAEQTLDVGRYLIEGKTDGGEL